MICLKNLLLFKLRINRFYLIVTNIYLEKSIFRAFQSSLPHNLGHKSGQNLRGNHSFRQCGKPFLNVWVVPYCSVPLHFSSVLTQLKGDLWTRSTYLQKVDLILRSRPEGQTNCTRFELITFQYITCHKTHFRYQFYSFFAGRNFQKSFSFIKATSI